MKMSSTIFSPESITMTGIGADHILTGHIGYLAKYFKKMQFMKMLKQGKEISEAVGASLPSVLQAYAFHSKKNYNEIYADMHTAQGN